MHGDVCDDVPGLRQLDRGPGVQGTRLLGVELVQEQEVPLPKPSRFLYGVPNVMNVVHFVSRVMPRAWSRVTG